MGTRSNTYNTLISSWFGLILVTGCNGELEQVQPSQESALLGTWTYELVEINGEGFDSLDYNFEIFPEGDEFLPEWVLINRRHLVYRADHSYDLQWGRGSNYVLGEEANAQPNFGFWQFGEGGQTLIHNPTLPYQVEYQILELTDTRFVRQSNRVMETTADSTMWLPGDVVVFREIFVPKE